MGRSGSAGRTSGIRVIPAEGGLQIRAGKYPTVSIHCPPCGGTPEAVHRSGRMAGASRPAQVLGSTAACCGGYGGAGYPPRGQGNATTMAP